MAARRDVAERNGDRRRQGSHCVDRGRTRVQPPEVRERRAPRPARAGDRSRAAASTLDGDGRGASRGRGGRYPIDPKDIRIDTFCSSGPGGQSVNTTCRPCASRTSPTGIVVSQQDEKSRIKNRQKAMKVLGRACAKRRCSGSRCHREGTPRPGGHGRAIREDPHYNFPQNRITDHRINYTAPAHRGAERRPVGAHRHRGVALSSRETEGSYRERNRSVTTGPGIAPRMSMTLHDRVAAARSRLAAAGLPADTAAFDAEALARIALGWSRAEYWRAGAIRRRPACSRMRRSSRGANGANRWRKSPGCASSGCATSRSPTIMLTPRPETELIVEEALANREAAPEARSPRRPC